MTTKLSTSKRQIMALNDSNDALIWEYSIFLKCVELGETTLKAVQVRMTAIRAMIAANQVRINALVGQQVQAGVF